MKPHQIHRRLQAYFPCFKLGRKRWSKIASGGWRFQHEHAHQLLDGQLVMELPSLFGGNGDFIIKAYEPPQVAFCYTPRRVHNDTLVQVIPGLFKVFNVKTKHNRKQNKLILKKCLFYTEESRARALREGATVERFSIEFRLPFRKPCSHCFSYNHKSCDCDVEDIVCRNCSSSGHKSSECKEETYATIVVEIIRQPIVGKLN